MALLTWEKNAARKRVEVLQRDITCRRKTHPAKSGSLSSKWALLAESAAHTSRRLHSRADLVPVRTPTVSHEDGSQLDGSRMKSDEDAKSKMPKHLGGSRDQGRCGAMLHNISQQ